MKIILALALNKLPSFIFCMVLFTILFIVKMNSQISIIGDFVHERESKAGEKYFGNIKIKNNDSNSHEVRIYQTDYLFSSDGLFYYDNPDSNKNPRSNAKWITINPFYFKIPPEKNADVHYIVNVPNNDSLKGTYWSMIMVESINRDSLYKKAFGIIDDNYTENVNEDMKQKEVFFKTSFRYGIQVMTNIEKHGERKIEIKDIKLNYKSDSIKILYIDLANTGENAVRPLIRVDIYDAEKGVPSGKFLGGRYLIYPNTSIRSQINISSIKTGKYRLIVLLDLGVDEILEGQFDLNME